MIPLEDFKKLLPDENLTEEQILKVRQQMDDMAEIFFGMWLKERNKKIF